MSDPFGFDLREQGRQMMVHGEAMMAAGRAMQEIAEREGREGGGDA